MMAKFLIFTALIFTFLLLHSPIYAQRPGTCGQPCSPGCVAGNTCISGVCVQFSCGVGNPCCRIVSIPPRTPTTPPARPSTAPVDTKPGINPTGNVVVPSVAPSVMPTSPAGTMLPGDCSGTTEGTADGKVDLIDFNLLRKEISGSASTTKCDFDANKVVDLLDFNIFRIAFITQT